jgi:putative endonuclease
MCFVYVLKSLKVGKHYIGMTNNIERRLERHNNGEVTATKSRRPLVLVYFEKHEDRESAARRELHFKSGQGREELNRLLKSAR